MANPTNQTNTTVPESTYLLLKEIKEKKGWTFDKVLDELCDLDSKYNYIEHNQKYELVYNDTIFHFEVIFKKQNILIKYITSYGKMTSKISEWGVPDTVRKKFYEFIHEDHCRTFLEYMPKTIIFDDFEISKINW